MNTIKYIPKKILKPLSRIGYGAKKVNLFILGAQKCGTSSVFNYLAVHPNTSPAYNKETGFFNKDYYFNKGTTYFHTLFPYQRKGDLAYEATPENLLYPYIPKRIYAYNPDSKFIVMLRDPVKRAYSSWNMIRIYLQDPLWRKNSIEGIHSKYGNPSHKAVFDYLLSLDPYLSFEEFVEQELAMDNFFDFNQGIDFIRRGIYILQVEQYLEYFPLERFMFIDIDKMKLDVNSKMEEITTFLGLSTKKWKIAKGKLSNAYPYESKIEPAIESKLRAFYQPYNERLEKLTGQTFYGQKNDSTD